MNNVNLLNINDADTHLCPFIQIPYYKLQQNGDFLCQNEIRKEVEFVWLAMSRSRAFWAKYEPGEKNIPICKSLDGKMPDGGTNRRSNPCESCPDSQWQGAVKNQKPRCSEIYTMLCWDLKKEIPFYFQVKRTGIHPLKIYRNSMRIRSCRVKDSVRYHLYVKGCMVSKMEKTRYRDVFIPNFIIQQEECDTGRIDFYYQMANSLVKEMQHLRFENDSEEPIEEYSEPYQDNPGMPGNAGPYQDNPGIPGNAAPVNVPATTPKYVFPDVTKENWGDTRVGLSGTGEMTWNDLAQNKTLPNSQSKEFPNGKSGHYCLKRLTIWKEWPEMADFAKYVIEKLCPEKFYPEPNFAQDNVQPPASVLA